MSEILTQLGHLFVQSIPTVVFVFLLLAILEPLLFKPVLRVLKEREDASQGALARASEQTALAEAKMKEYEAAFEAARQDVYRAREADRRAALEERERLLERAREESESWLRQAEATLNAEVEAAKHDLAASAQSLAAEITETVLGATSVVREGGVSI